MRTINDIATDMRMLSAYIGGGHYTNSEAESKLKALASELDDIVLATAISTFEYSNAMLVQCTGYSPELVANEIRKKHRVEKQP